MSLKIRTAICGVAALAVLGGGSAALARTGESAANVSLDTSANSAVSTVSDSAAIPQCSAGDLGVWIAVEHSSGAAGSIYVPLEFTNYSHGTCSLYGFPGVSAINADGNQLGSSAARDYVVPSRRIVLNPGATAHATLRYGAIEVQTSGCKPSVASQMRVYPPDQRSTTNAMFDLPSCTVSGHIYLTIEAIQAGA